MQYSVYPHVFQQWKNMEKPGDEAACICTYMYVHVPVYVHVTLCVYMYVCVWGSYVYIVYAVSLNRIVFWLV